MCMCACVRVRACACVCVRVRACACMRACRDRGVRKKQINLSRIGNFAVLKTPKPQSFRPYSDNTSYCTRIQINAFNSTITYSNKKHVDNNVLRTVYTVCLLPFIDVGLLRHQ